MITLGISAFYHDSAAALVRDGEVIAAAQEERFTRKKGDESFPARAVEYCLDEAGIGLGNVDYVGFYDKPLLTFNRLLETYITYSPSGFRSFVKAIPVWVREKLLQKRTIYKQLNRLDRGEIDEKQILFDFHHHSHAASAFYPSPFDEAAVLVVDGVGEWATTSMGVGIGRELALHREIRFPHSLGMLYSAFTYYLGFKVNDGEYKVMGLAPYGEPKYTAQIYEHLIEIKADGSFQLNMDYFDYCTGLKMTNSRFDSIFGAPRRDPSAPLRQRDMDVARSIQVVTEDAILALCRQLHDETGQRRVCLAGGVALNCVANGRIIREGPFEDVWIQPAAGDAGGALGVAFAIDRTLDGADRPGRSDNARDAMKGAYLGPAFDVDTVRRMLDDHDATYTELSDDDLYPAVADALADELIVGWFQGRMEFGPRALGNRSILGDARSPRMQRTLNLKIKYRESFRPFAPAVLAEDVATYFDLDRESPYMLIVADVSDQIRVAPRAEDAELTGLALLNQVRSEIPAVTHVDYTARVQTVHSDTNPAFHRLISAFKEKTGSGVLVNTSFNVRDEPIVCSPEDAYRCFMATEMDVLVLGNVMLWKQDC